jgi:hypothetical protein
MTPPLPRVFARVAHVVTTPARFRRRPRLDRPGGLIASAPRFGCTAG